MTWRTADQRGLELVNDIFFYNAFHCAFKHVRTAQTQTKISYTDDTAYVRSSPHLHSSKADKNRIGCLFAQLKFL